MWNSGLLDKKLSSRKKIPTNQNSQWKGLGSNRCRLGSRRTANSPEEEQEYDKMYGYYPVTVSKEIKQAPPDVRAGYTGGWGIAISKSCEDPVRAIKFLDWMCTEDANILRQWGIEGEHHTYRDGNRIFLPEVEEARHTDPYFGRKTGIGLYVYPWPRFPITTLTLQETGGSRYQKRRHKEKLYRFRKRSP